jgi:hypothetical protein
MTPAEAIDAMEGLGHDFFVFRDRDSNTIQARVCRVPRAVVWCGVVWCGVVWCARRGLLRRVLCRAACVCRVCLPPPPTHTHTHSSQQQASA